MSRAMRPMVPRGSPGAVTFFHDLAGELVTAAFAHIHMNAGLGFESLGDGVADFLVLTIIERQGNRIGRLGEGGGEYQAEQGEGQAAA